MEGMAMVVKTRLLLDPWFRQLRKSLLKNTWEGPIDVRLENGDKEWGKEQRVWVEK